jgi:hypothetical protein
MRAITLRLLLDVIHVLSLPEGDTKQALPWAAFLVSHVAGGSRAEVTSGFQTAPRSEMLFGIHLIPFALYQARRTNADFTHNILY